MDGIAKVLLEAGDLQGHLRRVQPQVFRRHDDVVGPAAVAIHADNLRVLAKVRPAGAAGCAGVADDVALCRNIVPDLDLIHHLSNLDHMPAKFVPHDHRRLDAALRPRIPLVDVQVRPADGRGCNLDQHFPRPRFGNRHLHQLQARGTIGLDDGTHHVFAAAHGTLPRVTGPEW